MTVTEGQQLWEASDEAKLGSRIAHFRRWLAENRGVKLDDDYSALWQWSVDNTGDFWSGVWDYFDVTSATPFDGVLDGQDMPRTRWFEGAQLNFAEYLLRHDEHEGTAVIAVSEGQPAREMSWAQLRHDVASVAAQLRSLGVRPGDSVASYMPNVPETLVALLATAAVGAVWGNCSPDFGTDAVIDRLGQLAPKVLFAADGYRYGGKVHDRRDAVEVLRAAMPCIEAAIVVPHIGLGDVPGATHHWKEVTSHQAELEFESVPFSHPLWVLYTSGTTGAPKGIVHGHGGTLLGWLVALGLHMDISEADRVLWYTQSAWIVWNLLISNLLLGATVVLYDGSPFAPDVGGLWRLVEETKATFLGTSASYVEACAKTDLWPGRSYDLSSLRALSYTASPLVPAYWGWIYERVKRDFWLFSASGGTEICGPLVGGTLLRPVRAGEFQCACLGVRAEAYDDAGRSVLDDIGEFVVTRPLPSMPVFLWGDDNYDRYRDQYFGRFPKVWNHGDAIRITADRRAVIYGRSDATINRLGVRFGSGEIYRALEGLPEILDSLMVDATPVGGESYVPLFVVLHQGTPLDGALIETIRTTIRRSLSPRHLPDEIIAVPDIPRTLTGKKLEVPIRRLLLGDPVDRVANPESMANPASLSTFVEFAASRQ